MTGKACDKKWVKFGSCKWYHPSMPPNARAEAEPITELEAWRRDGELITQQRIAELAGVSTRTAHLWCSGKTRPSVGQIKTLEAFRSGLVERFFPSSGSEPNGRGPMIVYFIRQGTEGPIKIGKSRDPGSRLRQLQAASPQVLHLLASSEALSEEEIHRRFAEGAIRNEWFLPTADLLAFIEALRESQNQ